MIKLPEIAQDISHVWLWPVLVNQEEITAGQGETKFRTRKLEFFKRAPSCHKKCEHHDITFIDLSTDLFLASA